MSSHFILLQLHRICFQHNLHFILINIHIVSACTDTHVRYVFIYTHVFLNTSFYFGFLVSEWLCLFVDVYCMIS